MWISSRNKISRILGLLLVLFSASVAARAAGIDHFNFSPANFGSFTAGVSDSDTITVGCFTTTADPPDANITVTLELVKDGQAIPHGVSPASFTTDGTNVLYGDLSPVALPLTFFYAGNDVRLRVSAPGATTLTSDPFTVDPGTAAKIVLLAPGQSHAPGRNPAVAGNIGRTGSATYQEANQAFPVRVLLTDNQFNLLTPGVLNNRTVHFASNESLVTLPADGALGNNGDASFNVTITAAKITRTLTVSDTTGGSSVQSGTLEVNTNGPPAQEVFPYPSPFNPKTGQRMTLEFRLEEATQVTLKVVDMFGQKVWETDYDGQRGANTGVVWDGRNANGTDAAAGIYYVLLEVGGSVKSKKKIGVVK